jgi:hypothetical protein
VDVKTWKDEAVEIASNIKTNAYLQGYIHDHLTCVIPEHECRLESEDNQTNPRPYPELDGDEGEGEIN